MKDEKLINPVHLKYCSFLDSNKPNANDEVALHTAYKRNDTELPKVCHSCGKSLDMATYQKPLSLINDKQQKYACEECSKYEGLNSEYQHFLSSCRKTRRKNVILSGLVAGALYALLVAIGFLNNRWSAAHNLFISAPIVAYALFSLIFCLLNQSGPVRKIIGGGFTWVGEGIAKPFESGNGLAIFLAVIFLPYFLGFFAAVSAVLIAVGFIVSIFSCPFILVGEYKNYID